MTGERKEVKSNCHYCGYLCAFIASVEDGRVLDLRPDPSRYPYSEQVARSCPRWPMNLDELDDPTRINHPLKRVGERGSGRWEEVSWDEALDDIATRLQQLSSRYGPQTLASAIGGPHANFWPLHRFMNLFGSPNNMGIGQICWNPHIWMDTLAFGWPIEVDIDPRYSGAVFLWGTNPAESDNSAFWRRVLEVSKSEIPLVVVDPRVSRTAAHATLHLAPRPGTDCTLALALIAYIIAEDLYDHGFVTQWCAGFEGLATHVAPYTPEYAEGICGIPADDIRAAARLFATSSATALLTGRGVDQLGPNTVPTHRALSALRAITGNVDRRGACRMGEMSVYTPEIDLEMSAMLSDAARAAQLNLGVSPLQSYPGYQAVNAFTMKAGRRLPERYLTSAHPGLVWKAVLEGDPYPVTALIVMAANPLLTYADTHLVHKALSALDLLVVLDYHRSPTAQMADYILPAAAALERPLFQMHGGVADLAYGGDAAVAPYYERKCDYDFFRELGIRLGQAAYWPEASLKEALTVALEPTGLTWEDFCERGIYCGPTVYGHHLVTDPETGEPCGFATASGKIELANELLASFGSSLYPEPVAVADPGRWVLDAQSPVSSAAPVCAEMGAGACAGECVDTQTQANPPDSSAGDRCALQTAPSADGLPRDGLPQNGLPRDGLPQDRPLQVHPTPVPLTMITGARVQPYWASCYRNNEKLRSRHPHPCATVSEKTALLAGLEAGEWVEIATERGSALFLLELGSLADGLISVEYGWWYPEEPEGEPGLSGLWRSNVNVLTSVAVPESENLVGTWTYNGIPCTVCPAPTV